VILHRDEYLIAANKPSGLLVHRGWDRDRDVLMTRVRDEIGAHVYPVHRLDRGASGVVLFALTPAFAGQLGGLFAERRVDKRYVALVRGAPPETGTIDHPIPRREGGPRVESVTDYRCLARFGRYVLVAAHPRSGRLHQIRRHLKHISCPLIGDVRYGKGAHNRLFRDRYQLRRLALHAAVLRFIHPTLDAPVSIHAPIPADLAEPLRALALDCGTPLDIADASESVARWSLSDQLLGR
jgi:tRNA pseudouridine65 synthase